MPLSRLDEDSSVYGGDLTVPQPGSWQVQVTSTEPAAEASATVEVAQATTHAPPASTSTTATPHDQRRDRATRDVPPRARRPTSDDDDGDSNTGLIALVVAAVVVVGGGVSWYLVSKRGSPKDTGSDDGLPPAAP